MPNGNSKQRRCNSISQRLLRYSIGFFTVCILVGIVYLAAVKILPYTTLTHPRAELHEIGQEGYLSVSAQPLSFDISSPQAFVYDMVKEEIVWIKGEERVVYPASTTKLMTALYALEVLSPDEVVTVGDEVGLIDPASSRAYIQNGQQLTVEMLIEGMMLPSGNDAAYALAAAVGRSLGGQALSGSEAVALCLSGMNTYAASLGVCGTTFTTPDGLAGEEHYTTLEDIILIARAAQQNEIIAKYAALAQDSVMYESGETITWYNTNALLQADSPYYREGVVGLKTGSLVHNYCLICTVAREDQCYMIGIFHAWDQSSRFEDACVIIDTLWK